jgi:ComF family protein
MINEKAAREVTCKKSTNGSSYESSPKKEISKRFAKKVICIKWELLLKMLYGGRDFLLALLFPLRCPVCDEIVTPFGSKICLTCRPKLQVVTSPRCFKCGKPLRSTHEEYCRDCLSKQHSYIRGRSLYHYQSAAPGIYRLKYGGRREYADFYGHDMAEHMKEFLTEIQPEALIPVPLHRKRQRRRGYNQSLLLAQSIARYTGIPVAAQLVYRVKNTAPMKHLTPAQRQNNLKKAFHMKENEVKLSTVVMIDDIYTTGSTIDAISSCLLEHGVKKVYFLALSCGEGV